MPRPTGRPISRCNVRSNGMVSGERTHMGTLAMTDAEKERFLSDLHVGVIVNRDDDIGR